VTLRLGLAGWGLHGSRYARHLLSGEIPGARLAALSRRDAGAGRRLAGEHGLAFVAEVEELATVPGVDAVVVVLPPDLHPAVATACLRAGRPVLVEKPLAADAGSAAAVAALAASTGTPLMVAHTLRFDPLVLALKREAASLGALHVVALSQRFEPTDRSWIDEPGRGGALLNTGVHGFDLIRFLTGLEVATVSCETSRLVTRRTEDAFAAVMRLTPGDALATLDNARTTAGRSGRIEIAGERGQVWGDHVHRRLVRIEGRAERALATIPAAPTVAEALRAFVAAVLGGGPMPVTAGDGAAAVALVDAARSSAATGRRVTV
jgi:predicted dehydrogenase